MAAAARPAGQGPSGGPQLFQLIFGYFAFSGLSAVDWGMAVRHRRDVRIGGWISVILAGSFCVILSLLTVAGAAGRIGPGPIDRGRLPSSPIPSRSTGRSSTGSAGSRAGTILMLFGLASLAPGVYAVFIYSTRLGPHWPAIGRRRWAWLGCGARVRPHRHVPGRRGSRRSSA